MKPEQIAAEIRKEADLAARPGQMARLNRWADEVLALTDQPSNLLAAAFNPPPRMTEQPEPEAGSWFIATCNQCTPRLPQPFRDETERNRWADAHESGTGHHVTISREVRD
jgi:hypothetical protein